MNRPSRIELLGRAIVRAIDAPSVIAELDELDRELDRQRDEGRRALAELRQRRGRYTSTAGATRTRRG